MTKPIFEPGDLKDVVLSDGDGLSGLEAEEVLRPLLAKLTSLGIDAETPEKYRILKKELLATVEERDRAEARLAELEGELDAARCYKARIGRMIAEARVVYKGHCVMGSEEHWLLGKDIDSTHSALLLQIEEIK